MQNSKWTGLAFAGVAFLCSSPMNLLGDGPPDSKPKPSSSLLVVVQQSYKNAKGVNLPIEDMIGQVLRDAAIGKAGFPAREGDGILRVIANGEALGRSYVVYPYDFDPVQGRAKATYRYTGASVSGTISLEIPGRPTYSGSFQGEKAPPSRIGAGPVEPSLAPFDEALRNSDFVGKLLTLLGKAYGCEPVISVMNQESRDVLRDNSLSRVTAAFVLGELKDKGSVEPLIAALKDKRLSKSIQREAARALSKIGDNRAVEPLIAALKDESLRSEAAEALGKIGDKRAVTPLIAVLEHKPSDMACWAAIDALGDMGDNRAVEPLIEVLGDENDLNRASAARALGKIGDKRAVGPLIHALKKAHDSYESTSSYCQALRDITHQNLPPGEWQKWWEENKGE